MSDSGDVHARRPYAELVREHLPDLLKAARWFPGRPGQAAELIGASLSEGSRRLGELNGHLAFRTWMLGIMCDLCTVDAPEGQEPGAVDAGGCTANLRRTVETDALPALVRALPDSLRRSVVLGDIIGLSYREIAAVLRIPVGAVRARIWRGRQALLEALCPVPQAERQPAALRLAGSEMEREVPWTGPGREMTQERPGG